MNVPDSLSSRARVFGFRGSGSEPVRRNRRSACSDRKRPEFFTPTKERAATSMNAPDSFSFGAQVFGFRGKRDRCPAYGSFLDNRQVAESFAHAQGSRRRPPCDFDT